MALGKWQKKALNFAREYPGWHSFAKDAVTKKSIKDLEKKGLVEVNQYGQFRNIGSNPVRRKKRNLVRIKRKTRRNSVVEYRYLPRFMGRSKLTSLLRALEKEEKQPGVSGAYKNALNKAIQAVAVLFNWH
jgi:hypothetical protein